MSQSIKHKAESEYIKILKKIEKIVGNKTTYATQLEKEGRKLFKKYFIGVFASDQVPSRIKRGHCMIVNCDDSTQPGSHWVSVCKEKLSDKIWVYDSFGRSISKILPDIGNGRIIKEPEDDVEQKEQETNCGARALAFIYIFRKFGYRYAKYI